MTEEQLKRANEIADKIALKKDELNNVQSSDRLMLYWKNNEYSVPIELPNKYLRDVREEYAKDIQGEIDELQKQFDEL